MTDLRVFCANFLGEKMRLCYFLRFFQVCELGIFVATIVFTVILIQEQLYLHLFTRRREPVTAVTTASANLEVLELHLHHLLNVPNNKLVTLL